MFRALSSFVVSLFRRDGFASVSKSFRYAFSCRAWKWLLYNARAKRLVKAAGIVDEDWYRREYPEVTEKGLDPVQDFLTPPHPWMRLPNPDFVPAEYLAANLDVMASGMIPAVHYASNGIREKRPVSTLESFEKPFPRKCAEFRREFAAFPAVRRRTAVFASFTGNGRIQETVLYYLRGLREVVDNIVFVCNAPVFPDEIAKLDGLVRLAVFRNHGGYDFGSYKIGWNEAKALGLLEPDVCDELVVCNDSCYGPVFPFARVFAEMARRRESAERPADFWGMSVVRQYGRRMIPSYFYVFGPAVLEGGDLDRWFDRMEPCRHRGEVVLRCESMLTQDLESLGYVSDGLVPESFQKERRATSFKHPLVTLRDYGDPLVKVKALKGDSLDDLGEARAFLRKANPELAAMIPDFGNGALETGIAVARAARLAHGTRLAETEAALRAAVAEGSPVDVAVLSLTGGESWLGPLVRALRGDARFSAYAAAVPDMRIPNFGERLGALRAARGRLRDAIPDVRRERLRTDGFGVWRDVFPNPGIVFFPTASDVSDFHYNPHCAVGREVLPVLVFDRDAVRYPLEKEFARQNYAYFRKIFFSDREAFDLYGRHSLRKGENAEFVPDAAAAVSGLSECLTGGVLPETALREAENRA